MTDPTTAYLAKLERAVRELPQPVAGDIVAGIREELSGLDADAARERIAVLGDPDAIAAAARDELPPATTPAVGGDARWYTVVTVLLIGIGGFVVPVVGWVVGIGFLWNSRTWTRRDKVVGTLIVPVTAAVVFGVLAVTGRAFVAPGIANRLVPSVFGFGHSGLVLTVVLASVASAVYLLVRARRLSGVATPARDGDAGWYTALVLVLLLIGGIVVPYVGWIAGVVLLWGSRTWRTVDKIIGTVAPPFGGGLSFLLLFGRLGGYSGEDPPVGVIVVAWTLMALPFVTFVYLLVRARILRR